MIHACVSIQATDGPVDDMTTVHHDDRISLWLADGHGYVTVQGTHDQLLAWAERCRAAVLAHRDRDRVSS